MKPYQEEGKIKQANPWLIAAREQLMNSRLSVLAEFKREGYIFLVKLSADAVWVFAHWPNGGASAFRVVHCPGVKLTIEVNNKQEKSLELTIGSALGIVKTRIEFLENSQPLLHWSTKLKSPYPLLFSCLPRDVYPLDENNDPLKAEGTVYSKQEGPKAGILYFTIHKPYTGSVFYMQNFTALNDYFTRTHSAPNNVVNGQWPELGFSLPNDGKTSLPPNMETTISDAFVLLSNAVPKDQFEAANQYLDMQIPIYFHLKRPQTQYHNYLIKADHAIEDLERSEKCSITIDRQKYLRPYVGVEDKPPESMVQLAVLMPLMEYENWLEETLSICSVLHKTIAKFYDSKLKTIVRYLPGVPFTHQNKEPQEDPATMDSWYLFHPLLNLARLANKGFDDARQLFFDSLDFAINGAHHFNYHWPVFYDMNTLEEKPTAVGSEGDTESDVACIYALVMVHAYELSNDKRYLQEAEKAAQSIDNAGFNLPYQVNVTAFGTSAFWRLYKITGKKYYKNLVSLCIANIFSNSWLWECNYGYAKNYRTFVGIPPLAKMHDNNYLASYEELEVLAAFDDLLLIADEEELSPAIRLLLAEYTRYVLDRCWSYFPSELPKEMITDKPKSGRIDHSLAFPLEDLREGWQKAGQVGQEVYGAGGILITITRHFNHQKGWPFIVYCEYPTIHYELDTNAGSLKFHVCGDNRLQCQLRLIAFKDKTVPKAKIYQTDNDKKQLEPEQSKEGHPLYTVKGGTDYIIKWKK